MFSGIIENIGTVKEYKKRKDYQLVLDTDLNFKDVKKGSSVCCNGVCLTVTSKKKLSKKTRLSFDVSKETVNCTNFNQIKIGDLVNIEKSLRVGDEISGHFVFGHVDDTASLVSSIKIGGSYKLKFKISKKFKISESGRRLKKAGVPLWVSAHKYFKALAGWRPAPGVLK